QTAKRAKELKRDMEAILLSNQGATAGSAPSTAPKTGSILAFIKTNVDFNPTGGGANPTYSTVPTDTRSEGTQRAFTKTQLETVLQSIWTEGGSPSEVMVGAHNKTVASAFAGIADAVHNVTGME